MEVTTTSTEDINGTTICENEMQVSIPSLDKRLTLTLIQSEWEMEPIFSGAAWAGSVLWAASQVLVENLLLKRKLDDLSVLELGCGLGIPGMVCSLLGAKEVLLTEQPQLVPLLIKNVERNFLTDKNDNIESSEPSSSNSSSASSSHLQQLYQSPKVAELSWGTKETELFLENRKENNQKESFDIILICDCVFEPLYGDSWILLSETLNVIVKENDSNTEVLIACERRDEDAIDSFLDLLNKTFIISIVWTNFNDNELLPLLENSHVGGEKKPLRIYSIKRRINEGMKE